MLARIQHFLEFSIFGCFTAISSTAENQSTFITQVGHKCNKLDDQSLNSNVQTLLLYIDKGQYFDLIIVCSQISYYHTLNRYY